ncbi:MAG: hypothetical protein GWN56_11695, partial [Nitrosopumilaceae archaeon]|nr:hypothetical protein [Nitrosopumilaceae archaeon]
IPNVISYSGIVVGILYNAIRTDRDKSLDLMSESSFGFLGLFQLLGEVPLLDSIFGIIIGGGILLVIAYTYEVIK